MTDCRARGWLAGGAGSILALRLVSGAAAPAQTPAPVYPWPHTARGGTVLERFPIPPGCSETSPPQGSFAEWLARLPLRPPGTEVRDRRGKAIEPWSPALAVVDVDLLGPQDCADTALRLRAEYLWG